MVAVIDQPLAGSASHIAAPMDGLGEPTASDDEDEVVI